MQLKDGTIAPLTSSFREAVLSSIGAMANRGLRVLAFAFKSDLGNLSDYTGVKHLAHESLINSENYISIESQLTFVGLAGLQVHILPGTDACIDLWIKIAFASLLFCCQGIYKG